MLTELSRYNLGVAFSRSYRGHINWWILVAFVVCYSSRCVEAFKRPQASFALPPPTEDMSKSHQRN